MYDSLLLSTGGGIISNVSKSLQTDEPVVVIGVGGTGAKALDTLKKKVYRQLQEDDPNSTVPQYEHIRFVEIDSDAEWMIGTELNNDQEFLNLQDKQVAAKFNDPILRKQLMSKPQFQWLEIEDIKIPAALHGAGGIRQLGRYLIVNSSQLVYNKIKSAISQAVTGKDASKLVIHIMAGISGGMGSGCFIDTCYIVRKVLQDAGWDAAVILGYFFLPDVITTIPSISSNTHKVAANYRNGYAALTELDYLMNLKENKGRFKQVYDGFEIDTDVPPVNMCHLVSALDAAGNSKPEGFKYCMNVVSDYVLAYLSKPEGGAISPKGNLTNIEEHMKDILPEHGAYFRYHVLGASNAELPMVQIATYLATELYKKMGTCLNKQPVDQDVVDFAEKGMELKVPDLKRKLTRDVKLAREVPKPQMAMVKTITASHVHAEAILKPMTDWLAQQEGVVERNFNGLNAELENGYYRDENATSLAGILYNKLYDLAVDADFGPYYAAGMLNRKGKDLPDILQGLHVEAEKLVKDAERQADFQAEQVEAAKQAFTASRNMFWNHHIEENAYDAYRDAMGVWYRRRLDTIVLRYVDRLILGLQAKATAMSQKYFSKLKVTLDELQGSFDANASYFAGGHGDDLSDDGFTIRIMKFSDVKPHLDVVLQAENAKDAVKSMVNMLLANADEWLSEDEYRIGKLINAFIYGRYQEELDKGVQKYLEQKYTGMDEAHRVVQLQHDIFHPLMQASEPLFWSSPSVSVTNAVSSITLSYPVASTDIATASNDFKNIHTETELRPTGIKDRIFMLRIYSGLPLFGYQGLELMKQRYDQADKAGVHLYGKGESNWKNLPTPIPYSLHEEAVKDGEEIAKAYNRAKDLNIVKVDTDTAMNTTLNQPQLNDKVALEMMKTLQCIGENKVTDDKDLNELTMSTVKEKYLMESGSVSMSLLADWQDRLKKLQNDITMGVYDEMTVSNYGKESVGLDNLIHSPAMVESLLHTVEIYNATELALRRLEKLEEIGMTGDKDIRDFSNALFGGVLKMGIGKIFFNYVEKHTEREAVLASKSMPFGSFLYYQAYVTFKDLEPMVKEDIVAQANQKMDNLQEGDDEIARKIAKKCTPADMRTLEMQYNKLKEKDDIKDFYNKFLDLMYEFIDQFE